MRIVIDPFDPKSIARAERLVRQYQKRLLKKEKEFVRRLAEIGVQVADAGFRTADYDGENDVRVRVRKTADGYAVVASGKTVGFIEFGTGVRYPEWEGENMDYTPPAHGTYGQGRGKNPQGWWYANQKMKGVRARHTQGNPPAEAMLTARDEMVDSVFRIAREVLRWEGVENDD